MPVTLTQKLSADLIERLRNDVARLLALNGMPSLVYGRAIHNPYSDVHILCVEYQQLKRRIYVKIPHTEKLEIQLAQSRLAAEFSIMQLLCAEANGSEGQHRYGTVTPIGYYPDYPAIATFEGASQTLRQHYRSAARLFYNGRSRAFLLDEVKSCGLWLRDFQQKTFQRFDAFDTEKLVAYLEVRLDLLVKKSVAGFTQALAQKIIDQVRNHSARIAPKVHKITGRHQDFASHNILSERGRIWVVDFSMYDTDSSAFDPAYFWLDLEMLRFDFSYSNQFIQKLQEIFLDSYGLISTEDPAFQLVRCQYSINRILTLHSKQGLLSFDDIYHRAVVHGCMAWIERFLGEKALGIGD